MIGNMTTNERVTANVERLMKREGLSMRAMARQLGHTAAWSSRKMSGHRQWTMDELDLLAALFKVSPAALVRLTERYAFAVLRHTARYAPGIAA